MLIRKNEFSFAHKNSEVWEDDVTKLLEKIYKKELASRKLRFKIFGLEFPDEVVVIVSLLSSIDPMLSATSIFLACDINQDKNPHDSTLKLLNLSSKFLDLFFNSKEWDDYLDLWQDDEDRGFKFAYKITRENVELSIEADKILNQD